MDGYLTFSVIVNISPCRVLTTLLPFAPRPLFRCPPATQLSTQSLPEDGNKPGGSPRAGNVSMDSSAVGGSSGSGGGAATRPGAYVPPPGALGASGGGGLAVSAGLQQQQQQHGLQQLQTQLSVGGLTPLGNGASGVAPINAADPIPEVRCRNRSLSVVSCGSCLQYQHVVVL